MAEFKKVMKQRERMCKYAETKCDNRCDLHKLGGCFSEFCNNYICNCPQEAEEIIMNWAKEHPAKTNADKFKEVFGVKPSYQSCPYTDTTLCQNTVECKPCDCCEYYDFWEQEYKEPKEV